MKIVIADTGALISLALVGEVNILSQLFDDFFIAEAVWLELNNYDNPNFDRTILLQLKDKVVPIKGKNHLATLMDFGESESVILYEELKASWLLIDDQKARSFAESLDINCIGSIGLLVLAKKKNILSQLRPIFESWLKNGRYFSRNLLNDILKQSNEDPIEDSNL